MADAFVVGLVHETGQRRKSAVQQHFEIADLARSQIPRRQIARFGFEFGGGLAVEDEVDEFAAMRRDQMTSRSNKRVNLPVRRVRWNALNSVSRKN